jgi:hypothetical protein
MGVCKEHGIDLARAEVWGLPVLLAPGALSLEHAAVDQDRVFFV